MSNVIPFSRDEFTIRTVEIDGEAWFVGKDVCDALGYSNPSKAMGDHCKGVTKRYPLQTSGGEQEARVLPESDVLRLIIGSRLPAAERFERWVFEEVLPTIRKTGQYGKAAPAADLSDPATLRQVLLGYTEKVIALEGKVHELAPKAAALDLISRSDGSRTITEAAKELKVTRDALTKWMHANHWVYRQNGSWVAYDAKIRAGLLEYKEANYTDNSTGLACIKPYCHITPKGLVKLAEAMAVGGKAA